MLFGFRSTRRVCFLSLFLVFLFVIPTAHAYKKVRLDFEPGWCPEGVNSTAVKSQIIARINSHFSFAGTLFSLVTNGTDFHKMLIFKTGAGAAGWEPPNVTTGYVYGGTFKSAFANSTNLFNSTAVGKAMGLTAAHELGHHLGCPHNPTPTGVMQEDPYPTLGGRLVTNKTFIGGNKTRMMTYLRSTDRNYTSAGKDDYPCNFVMVYGHEPIDPNIIEDEPYMLDVRVVMSGNFLNFEFGYFNIFEEFVSVLKAGEPEGMLSFFGNEFVSFAVRDVNSQQVFPVTVFGYVSLYNPVDPSQSQVPVVDVPYYQTAEIDMPSLGLFVTLDTFPFGQPHGFVCSEDIQPHGGPGLTEWGIAALLLILAAYAVWKVRSRTTRSGT